MFALFDLDDTLHDKTASLEACSQSMHAKFLKGSGISTTEFSIAFVNENCIIQPKIDVFAKLASMFSIDKEVETIMLDYFDTSFHSYSKPFDHVYESMEFLKKSGVPIACVTNGRDFFQRNKIKSLGLTQYFDVIVTSGELATKKPDPFIFTTALEKLGAHASESIFIGDSLKADMQPANRLGMQTIWVSTTTNQVPDFVDHQLTNFKQFKTIWQTITNIK